MNNILEQYERFFRLQRKHQEEKYELYAKTPLKSLFANGRAHFGSIVGTTEHGQMILHFETKTTPRLKVPMVVCIIRKKSYDSYGSDISSWTCNSLDYRNDYNSHTSFSDILPIYYLKNQRNTIGCGRVSIEMLNVVRTALNQHKNLKFIMLETLPPTELLMNLAEYIKLHPGNPVLSFKPKIKYDDWTPIELESTDNVPEKILERLTKHDVCVLQGPPGTGKSFALASIVSKIALENKSICVTTQSNASLISLVSQDTMKPLIEQGTISKTVLTAEEKSNHQFLRPADKDLLSAKRNLLCTTYYSLSRIINKVDSPIYDLIVIEEASQAFLTAIAAFMRLGKKCLIVGDPMQLPPIVENRDSEKYRGIDIDTQANGMLTYVCSQTDVPCYRMTTSFRLTPASTELSKYFYGGNFTSVQKKKTLFNVPADMRPFFPDEGGTIIYTTDGTSGGNCSKDAMGLIKRVVDVFAEYYPKRRLAILSPFVLTTNTLQAEFCKDGQTLDLLVDTINRIQGETVDYTIYYIPLRNHGFAFSDNLFNVATSRSKSTTLLITDAPLEIIPIKSNKVRQFLSNCVKVNLTNTTAIDSDEVKSESIADELPDNGITQGCIENGQNNPVLELQSVPGVKVVGKIDLSRFEKPKKELSKTKKNYYIIDTNVFVNYPEIISKIDPNYPVILSAKVADELDKMKIKLSTQDKANAEKALRLLNQITGRDIRYEMADTTLLPEDFDKRSPDNMILSVALKYKNGNPIVLTSDNGLQLKSKILGITTISLKAFLKQLKH